MTNNSAPRFSAQGSMAPALSSLDARPHKGGVLLLAVLWLASAASTTGTPPKENFNVQGGTVGTLAQNIYAVNSAFSPDGEFALVVSAIVSSLKMR